MILTRRILEHPLTRGLDIDHPATTDLRRRILAEKPFLRALYREWYARLRASVPEGQGAVVELGAGAGFFDETLPATLRSDVLLVPGIDFVADGHCMPLRDRSCRALVMTNVLHHLRSPTSFFAEASRCLRPGGVLATIEPWVTPWSSWIYRRFHHEPFDPAAQEWSLDGGGPLSGANGAMAWLVFARDRLRFARENPELRIRRVSPLMPVSYLLSGGVSRRALAPGASFRLVRACERVWPALERATAMFAEIVVERRGESEP